MLITELFNTQHDLEIEDSDSYFQATAPVAGHSIVFYADRDELADGRTWTVEFYKDGRGRDKFKLTGEGNEFEILALVKRAMLKFISMHSPERIVFLADKQDQSRVTLYARMLKRFAHNYTYTKTDNQEMKSIEFALEKK